MPYLTEDRMSSDVEAILRDVIERSTPVQHGPHFDELVALIEEELRAQIAIGRLGPADPPAGGTDSVALLIADMVDRVFSLELRDRR